MKILVVKLTSMGDVLHLLPALTDLQQAHPHTEVDWLVEDTFSELPAWHPMVNKVIAVASRRWRKQRWKNRHAIRAFIRDLRSQRYDMIIDAQGLIKSALIARLAKLAPQGLRVGFSSASIKESPAGMFYQHHIDVTRSDHAINRLRTLFANSLNYPPPDTDVDYQITQAIPQLTKAMPPSIFLLHGTTWQSKHLPDTHWRELAELIVNAGYQVILSWGNETERQRAEWIAHNIDLARVLPKSNLQQLASELVACDGAIAVDTGLGHMAAALSVPTVSIYGSTNAQLTGTQGKNQTHLAMDYPCSPCLLKQCDKLNASNTTTPCYQSISAAKIWQTLHAQLPPQQ